MPTTNFLEIGETFERVGLAGTDTKRGEVGQGLT